jgi:hypothetical protein
VSDPTETGPDSPPAAPVGADAEHVAERALLLPEEQAAGSDDPHRQAETILAESEERTLEPEATREDSPQSQ